MKNTKLAFCKFSKYPILKSIRVKFSRYKQKSMNVSVSFDTLILLYDHNSGHDGPVKRTRIPVRTEKPGKGSRLQRVPDYGGQRTGRTGGKR